MHSQLLLAYVAVSSSGAAAFLIHLLVLGIIFALIWYVISLLPLPAPFKQIFTIVYWVILAIFLIDLLLSLDGGSFILWR